jgi:alpha-tubulin suppressor-like RCC1 family protein
MQASKAMKSSRLAAITLLLPACNLVLGLGDYKDLCPGGQVVDDFRECPDAGASGGTGGAPECKVTADCPDPGTTCVKVRCTDSGTCDTTNAKLGSTCVDAKGSVCDGEGHCVGCNVAKDCSAPATSCKTVKGCTNHVCELSDEPAGTACNDANGHICNATGQCFGVTAIATGAFHTCAVTSLGGLKCWGSDSSLQLGTALASDMTIPEDVMGLDADVRGVAAGVKFTCALLSSGQVKCWGFNGDGELGDGKSMASKTPVSVNGISDAKQLSVNSIGSHACALTKAGTVKCWGFNFDGELGDGTTTDRNVPGVVSIPTPSGPVTAVSAGGVHTCSMEGTNGSYFCWGSNAAGELGNGSMTSSTTPVPVYPPTDTNTLALGDTFSCGTTTDGGAFCWGDNSAGQLGDGTYASEEFGVAVKGLGNGNGVTAIAAGLQHACALTSAGAVKCWGDGTSGDLGNGNASVSNTPVDVTGLSAGVKAIAAGAYHSCALMSSGGVKCWGDNSAGQLGTGSMLESDTPVDVQGL